MQRLISELTRLFLLPGDGPSGSRLPPDGPVAAALQAPLEGRAPAAPAMVDGQGRCRLMAVGFHGVRQGQGAAHCGAMLALGKALIEELGLPEPAFSVNGREGFDLWLSLAAPVPVAEARELVALLQALYLKELPGVRLWPAGEGDLQAGVSLPPALHPATGLWSVFIAPGLAPSFIEEAGIDIAPNLDKQAELLAKLQPIEPAAFGQALQVLRRRAGAMSEPVPAPAAVSAGTPAPAPASLPRADAAEPPAIAAAPSLPAGAGPALPGVLAARRDELIRALARPPAAVETPFAALNGLLHGGFRGGRLYALLAPPKAGKTTLAALWIDHAAALGHPALYVGYEMARAQLVHAALARRLRLDARRIEAGALAPDEAERVAAALDAYLAREGQALEIREAAPGAGLAEVEAWARAAAAARPGRTPLVVIDPLPLAGTGLPSTEAQAAEGRRAHGLAAACKDLARSTGAAVIALSALPRPAEREADLLADPDAQALLRAADGVLLLQARMPALQDAAAADAAVPARVRLQLLSHRGRIGELALLHWRAFHAMEEAPATA